MSIEGCEIAMIPDKAAPLDMVSLRSPTRDATLFYDIKLLIIDNLQFSQAKSKKNTISKGTINQ